MTRPKSLLRRKPLLILAAVAVAVALVYWLFLRTDFQAVFKATTGVSLPEETRTLASCEQWGVQAAVLEIPTEAWSSFVRSLRAASPERERSRRYSGVLCESVLPSLGAVGETGTVPGGQHEGLVWALNEPRHRVLWEVWY
jgi:hypothetical protein